MNWVSSSRLTTVLVAMLLATSANPSASDHPLRVIRRQPSLGMTIVEPILLSAMPR